MRLYYYNTFWHFIHASSIRATILVRVFFCVSIVLSDNLLTCKRHPCLPVHGTRRRGDQKNFMDCHCKILVAQSISLIFLLAINSYKFNKHFKFRCEILRNKINMTFYRINGVASQPSLPVSV